MSKTTYLWDELSDNVIEEYEGGVLSASYTHEPGLYGNLLSENRNGTTHYYHYDARGDTVALTDDSGSIVDTADYDAFGNIIASTGATQTPYRFVGRNGYQRDALVQSVYVRARHFLPRLDRWATQDPLGYMDNINVFGYVKNRVIMTIDPSGMIAGAFMDTRGGENCEKCLIFDCRECAQFPAHTAYGCHCGPAAANVPDGRPIDTIDFGCREHDKCWGNIQPKCAYVRPTLVDGRLVWITDPRHECRKCDATFCEQLEAGDCTEYDPGSAERDTCMAYRCYAMAAFNCRAFKIPEIGDVMPRKRIGRDWPFGVNGEESCIPFVGRWPPPGDPTPNVKKPSI